MKLLTQDQIEQFLKIEKETIGSANYSDNTIKGVFDEVEGHETSLSMTMSTKIFFS